MSFGDWLGRIRRNFHSPPSRLRRPRRRHALQFSLAATEVCEQRVMLSGDTLTDPDTLPSETPSSDLYGSGDYFDAALDSPLGDEVSTYSDQIDDFANSSSQSAQSAFDDAMSSQQDAESTAESESSGTTTTTFGTSGTQRG